MTAKITGWIRIALICCAITIFSSGLSLSASSVEKPAALSSIRYEVERNAWEEGVRAFEKGDYAGSAITFQMLSESAQTSDICRKALFAFASVRLVLAKTPEEYLEAISAWERWSSQIRTGLEGEDPRMITPFLLKLSPAVQSPDKSDQAGGLSRKGQKDANSNVTNYKNLLQSKDKEVENLRAKLESREREVRRLRHQLESLEEIHRKYQEKKQEASAP
jgi:hypothetical protein